jgi:1A family penicillin-binding protein
MPRSHKIKRNFLSFFGKVLIFGWILSLIFAIAFILKLFRELPPIEVIESGTFIQSTKIYDRTGKILLYEIHGKERRTIVPLKDLPEYVKFATLAAEDTKFYTHPAFDIRAILRAIWHNITKTPEESLQGGSTITQQLVKNALLSRERTINRKIKEIILAVQLERRFSKDEILEMYLNQIPYGSNAYGIEAASQTYFGKHAKELSLKEASMLAALLKAPTFYASNPEQLNIRTNYVIDRMVAEGFISMLDGQRAKEEKVEFKPFIQEIRAPHFVMYVKQLLEKKYGKDLVENGGLKIITTLDYDLQILAEEIVRKKAQENKSKWNASNAALVAEDPKTGQILAMVGSKDFFGESEPKGCIPGRNCLFDPQVNASISVRQPGSAFKPFVYYGAFKMGYVPQTVIFDVPTEFNPNCTIYSTPIVPGAICYQPKNYDNSWRGPVTLKKALAQSLNIPAVKVLYLVGIENTLNIARDFGITTLNKNPNEYGLSLVLGGGGVKLTELTHAYSVLAQDGIYRPQNVILKIEDSHGNILEEYEDKPKRVAESKFVRLVNDILSDSNARTPIFPPGALDVAGYKVAVKTGTSQDYIDAWVFGYTPNLVTGVWVGNNDNSPMAQGGAGFSAAAPIMKEFMIEALKKFPNEEFPEPEPPDVPKKPMLSGNYIVWENEIPKVHSILYYVDRTDPLGPKPVNPAKDPQFLNWELAVRKWYNLDLNIENPLYEQNQKFEPEPKKIIQPEILIFNPEDGSFVEGEEIKLNFKLSNMDIPDSIYIYFNGLFLTNISPNEENIYEIYFVPPNWKAENKLTVYVKEKDIKTSKTIKLFKNL